jgi:toxin secretion/phage lysis holin
MEIFNQKIAASAFFGTIASWFGGISGVVCFTFGAVMLDYITGLLAGRANEGLNSKCAVKGLYKKAGIFFLLFLGLFLDGAVNYFMAEGSGFLEIPFRVPIAYIVTVWIVITEAISVCENLERMGVRIPKRIMKILRKAEKQADQENEEDDKK